MAINKILDREFFLKTNPNVGVLNSGIFHVTHNGENIYFEWCDIEGRFYECVDAYKPHPQKSGMRATTSVHYSHLMRESNAFMKIRHAFNLYNPAAK